MSTWDFIKWRTHLPLKVVNIFLLSHSGGWVGWHPVAAGTMTLVRRRIPFVTNSCRYNLYLYNHCERVRDVKDTLTLSHSKCHSETAAVWPLLYKIFSWYLVSLPSREIAIKESSLISCWPAVWMDTYILSSWLLNIKRIVIEGDELCLLEKKSSTSQPREEMWFLESEPPDEIWTPGSYNSHCTNGKHSNTSPVRCLVSVDKDLHPKTFRWKMASLRL